MGRIRTIKPEFPQSESIGRLSRDARLLFIQLWTIVDDSGRTRAASRMLASILFPYDDDAPRLIDGWIAELQAEEIVNLYEIDGSTYLEIVNWLKHQKVDHPTPSKIPAYSREFAKPRECSRSLAPDLGPGPRTKDQDLDLDVDQENTRACVRAHTNGASRLPAAPLSKSTFEQFWETYPHKVGKGRAKKAFPVALKKTSLSEILLAIDRYVAAKPRDRPWCNPSTWLNEERWLDSEMAIEKTVFDVAKRHSNGSDGSGSAVVCDVRPGEGDGKNPSVLDSIFGPRR